MSGAKRIKVESTLNIPSVEEQSSEEESWAEKAVEALLKKLKEKNSAVDELRLALSNPDRPSKCITIPQYLGSDFQRINHENIPAHVIACRIWRWPDLMSSQQLRRQEDCTLFSGAFSQRNNEVCINPHHYDRVDSSTPPMDLSQDNAMPGPSGMQSGKFQNPCDEAFIGHFLSFDRKVITTSNLQPPPPPSSSSYPNRMDMEPSGSLVGVAAPQTLTFGETSIWASITYYEQKHIVGEVFHCETSSVTVDGFTSFRKTCDKFSVGHLNNIHRTPIIENTRVYIGKGVRLTYISGEVFAENLSVCPIFFHSVNLDEFPSSTSCTILPGKSLKIFNNQKFAKLLSDKVNLGSYAAVFNLHKICTLRISFVRGWGASVDFGDKVTPTPCWIEIQLRCPLQWLDNVLREFESPKPVDSNDLIIID